MYVPIENPQRVEATIGQSDRRAAAIHRRNDRDTSENFDENNLNDFVDIFLNEMHKHGGDGPADLNNFLNAENTTELITVLVTGGMDTISAIPYGGVFNSW